MCFFLCSLLKVKNIICSLGVQFYLHFKDSCFFFLKVMSSVNVNSQYESGLYPHSLIVFNLHESGEYLPKQSKESQGKSELG